MTSTISVNPLRAYLDRHSLTLAAFADRIESYPANVRRYSLPFDHREFERPRQATMAKIVEATNGEVQPNQFYGLPPSEAAAVGAA